MYSMYNADGSRIKLGSKGHKMLKYIVDHGTVSKYELVTKVLGKVGSRQSLRGYYSCYMRGWRRSACPVQCVCRSMSTRIPSFESTRWDPRAEKPL